MNLREVSFSILIYSTIDFFEPTDCTNQENITSKKCCVKLTINALNLS